jgi:hypothetical protein
MSMIPFSFRAIPANEAEPVRGGMVVMQDVPDETEIRRVVEPMLGGFTTTLVKVLDERSARCSFTSFAFRKNCRDERMTTSLTVAPVGTLF